jgi:hypothetical protein
MPSVRRRKSEGGAHYLRLVAVVAALGLLCLLLFYDNSSRDLGSLLSLENTSIMKHHNFEYWMPTEKAKAAGKAGKHESYSQKGQDEWVLKTLQYSQQDSYFYVDLAANFPERLSNSKLLDLKGWSGLCIDGNRDLLPALRDTRSCIAVEAIADACDGQQVAWAGSGTQKRASGGGIVGKEYDLKPKNVKVSDTRLTTTLDRILDTIGAPAVIDYLSLDVEGAEWRVMQNFPFERYTFRTVTIERPSPWLNKLLAEKGYVWVKNFKWDSFYVHKSVPLAAQSRSLKMEQVLIKCRGIAGTDCPWTTQPDDAVCSETILPI